MNNCPLSTFHISQSGKQSLYPGGDPDCHQNLTICSVAHCQPSLKILYKSVQKFLRKTANRQKQTDKQRRLHNLLDRGNQAAHSIPPPCDNEFSTMSLLVSSRCVRHHEAKPNWSLPKFN